jgi:hypothetical protein
MDGGSTRRKVAADTGQHNDREITYIYASSGIRTHDPRVWAGEDSLCPCDRLLRFLINEICYQHFWNVWLFVSWCGFIEVKIINLSDTNNFRVRIQGKTLRMEYFASIAVINSAYPTSGADPAVAEGICWTILMLVQLRHNPRILIQRMAVGFVNPLSGYDVLTRHAVLCVVVVWRLYTSCLFPTTLL